MRVRRPPLRRHEPRAAAKAGIARFLHPWAWRRRDMIELMPRPAGKATASPRKRAPSSSEAKMPVGAPRGPLPAFREPSLALLTDMPPRGPQWVHELKFDGYR